jgi:hypothetical protein
MEQVDFDEWLKNFKPVKPKYFAVYDPESGSVESIWPESGLENKKNTIELDDETAQLITEGKLSLNNCFVDFESGEFQIAEIKVLNKIDDVLHRVIEKKWSAAENEEDFFITYDDQNKNLRFELSSRYNGTHISTSGSKRKIRWDGSTVMTFLITDYNDPNYVYQTIKIKIDDLINNFKEFTIVDVPNRFSVYTKRLFPNYVMDIK